jgi:hypothetical protein
MKAVINGAPAEFCKNGMMTVAYPYEPVFSQGVDVKNAAELEAEIEKVTAAHKDKPWSLGIRVIGRKFPGFDKWRAGAYKLMQNNPNSAP